MIFNYLDFCSTKMYCASAFCIGMACSRQWNALKLQALQAEMYYDMPAAPGCRRYGIGGNIRNRGLFQAKPLRYHGGFGYKMKAIWPTKSPTLAGVVGINSLFYYSAAGGYSANQLANLRPAKRVEKLLAILPADFYPPLGG